MLVNDTLHEDVKAMSKGRGWTGGVVAASLNALWHLLVASNDASRKPLPTLGIFNQLGMHIA